MKMNKMLTGTGIRFHRKAIRFYKPPLLGELLIRTTIDFVCKLQIMQLITSTASDLPDFFLGQPVQLAPHLLPI
jgi:hypothetical protein